MKAVLWVVGILVVIGMIFGDGDKEPLDASAADSGVGESSRPASDGSEAREKDDDRKPSRLSKPKRSKTVEPAAAPKPKPRPRTFLVARVVDGDTLELANGESVRLVGIDTPERGECGYDTATANLARLVLGKSVRLGMSDEDRDRYGRLLRYVNVGSMDAGLRQIKSGWAIARYDSRDGYGYHPRENAYIATDKAVPDRRCAEPQQVPAAPAGGGGCEPGYNPCVPAYPPDVDCADVDGPITVTGSDPHGLDGEGDGIACE